MLVEIGSVVLATMLSLAGVSMPQLAQIAADSHVLVPACESYHSDMCLASEVCEVFISEAGSEKCALACDLRDAASCQLDGECELIGGVCSFPADEPAGC